MKILDIRLMNLNSLRGKWHINLEDNAYVSSGIFAVTGPTGAGKTTLFDAVCLALYSHTPRLGRIGGQNNEIMSRRTSECYAKVIFSVDGRKYLCEWEQHRAGGKLQTAKHTISDAKTGEILGSQKSSTIGIVEGITGMTFEQFRQSVLLEQGGFNTFLKSDKNKRAEVLELITGTGIYSEISRRVYQRSKDEAISLEKKRTELDEVISGLEGRTEETLQADITQTSGEISRLEAEHKSTEELRAWHSDILRLKRELEQKNDEIMKHERRCEDFEGDRRVLVAAERSGKIEAEYLRLMDRREAHVKVKAETAQLSGKISESEKEFSRISGIIPVLSDELSHIRGEITELPDIVCERVKSAVNDYDRLKKEFDEAVKSCAQAERELSDAKAKCEKIIVEGKKSSARRDKAEEHRNTILDQIDSISAKTTSAVLDEERAKLIEGQPCPLCGSIEHNCAVHTVASGGKSDELFRQKQKLEAERKKAEEALRNAQRKLESDRDKWRMFSAAEICAHKEYARLIEVRADIKQRIADAHIAVSEAIRPMRISGVRDTTEVLRLAGEWAAKVKGLEERIQDSMNDKNNLEAGLVVLRGSFEAMQEKLEASMLELEGLEASFLEKLKENNFTDEKEFLSSLRDTAEVEHLRVKGRELDAQSDMLKGARQNIQNSLEEKQAMKLTQDSLEDIEAAYNHQEKLIRELHARKALLEENLRDYQELRDKAGRLSKEYEFQKLNAGNWAALSRLIGSSDGDKFRVFAQKVTLELVVNNANEYLRRMNGRYTLILTPESDKLELSVKDHEQSGEIRPTENLSGGERFIISLALALGLSHISGSRTRVDSLFLDEGFGSLDEEALNAALDALGEVKREGRMIGIISHVSGISERIAVKINVVPRSEGVSMLEGPGCSNTL